jgi:hypothetical protein
MKNINNKSILAGFGAVALLAIGMVFVPALASAEEYGYNYTFSTSGGPHVGAPLGSNSNPNNNQNNNFNNNQNNNQNNNSGNNGNFDPNRNNAGNNGFYNPNDPYANNPNYNQNNNANGNNDPRSNQSASAYDALVGSTLFGSSDGFMPSSIVEWIFVAILVLIIVILGRKIFGADLRYFAKPLKHD